jgi:type VI protein secretion system component VasF
MATALKLAPYAAAVIWIFIAVNLFRGGFRDLTERLTRPRWAGPERARAAMMLPLRTLMLAGVAGFAAAMTVLGLLFNAAVVLNIVQLVRGM